jgi:hypothetical protein
LRPTFSLVNMRCSVDSFFNASQPTDPCVFKESSLRKLSLVEENDGSIIDDEDLLFFLDF